VSKYERLGVFLREQGRDHIPMTFAEIERVVGTKLPRSKEYPAWWSNSTSNNVMTRIWLDAGYRTEQVDVTGRKLVFRRATRARGMQEEGAVFNSVESQKAPRHPAIGALKGLFTIEPGYAVETSDAEETGAWESAADRTADLYESGRTKK
jgi:hypothetical protein